MKKIAEIKLPKIMGHQGCQDKDIQGNTKAAFKEAKKQGAEWIEIDVQMTKDKQLVLSHSYFVSGASKYRKKLICKTNLKDLRKLTAKTGEEILTFDEGLASIKELGLKVNVEMKAVFFRSSFQLADETMKILQKHGFDNEKDVYVSSFSKKALYAAKFLKPKIPRCLLDIGNTPCFLKAAKKLECFAVGFDKRFLTNKLIKKIKQNGFQILAFTSNQQKKATELLNKGINVVITDKPNILQNEISVKAITALKNGKIL